MTAKEMFEKLHFREIITEDGNYIYEKWHSEKYYWYIAFYVEAKYVYISFGQHQRQFWCFDNDELDAIEKKRKELGWAKCTCR